MTESQDAGEPIDDVLARIGSPSVCAAKIIGEQQAATGRDLGETGLPGEREEAASSSSATAAPRSPADGFHAPDAPDITLHRPGRRWHAAKVGLEKYWLRRWA